ncbi:MAG: YcbK family protein, partial [Calditrichia bacterium]
MGDIGTYFNRSEFQCPCGCGFNEIDPKLVHLLDKIREALGHPLKVNSGCRCPAYNKTKGGKRNSAHLRGLAADIRITNSRDRFIAVSLAIRWGITRIGQAGDFI